MNVGFSSNEKATKAAKAEEEFIGKLQDSLRVEAGLENGQKWQRL